MTSSQLLWSASSVTDNGKRVIGHKRPAADSMTPPANAKELEPVAKMRHEGLLSSKRLRSMPMPWMRWASSITRTSRPESKIEMSALEDNDVSNSRSWGSSPESHFTFRSWKRCSSNVVLPVCRAPKTTMALSAGVRSRRVVSERAMYAISDNC